MTRQLALAALAMVAFAGAGCSKATDTTSGAGAEATGKATTFSACMRDHGVKDFPDPDSTGQLTIDAVANRSSVDTSSATFTQALSACRDLEPPAFTGTKRTAQQQETALRFAQCIRDNGVRDFPDPTPDAPLVDTNRIPSAAGTGGMSILNAAMRKCGDLAAGAGVTGGR